MVCIGTQLAILSHMWIAIPFGQAGPLCILLLGTGADTSAAFYGFLHQLTLQYGYCFFYIVLMTLTIMVAIADYISAPTAQALRWYHLEQRKHYIESHAQFNSTTDSSPSSQVYVKVCEKAASNGHIELMKRFFSIHSISFLIFFLGCCIRVKKVGALNVRNVFKNIAASCTTDNIPKKEWINFKIYSFNQSLIFGSGSCICCGLILVKFGVFWMLMVINTFGLLLTLPIQPYVNSLSSFQADCLAWAFIGGFVGKKFK